jgi:hypothetical protein
MRRLSILGLSTDLSQTSFSEHDRNTKTSSIKRKLDFIFNDSKTYRDVIEVFNLLNQYSRKSHELLLNLHTLISEKAIDDNGMLHF